MQNTKFPKELVINSDIFIQKIISILISVALANNNFRSYSVLILIFVLVHSIIFDLIFIHENITASQCTTNSC